MKDASIRMDHTNVKGKVKMLWVKLETIYKHVSYV